MPPILRFMWIPLWSRHKYVKSTYLYLPESLCNNLHVRHEPKIYGGDEYSSTVKGDM